LFAEGHQSLSENVSKQPADDRADSHRCSSGNKHPHQNRWRYSTGKVLRESVVLFTRLRESVGPVGHANPLPHESLQSCLLAAGNARGPVRGSLSTLLQVRVLLQVANFNQSWSWNAGRCTKWSVNF